MPVTLNLNSNTEQLLREKAALVGQTLEAYLEGLAERDVQARDGVPPAITLADFERHLEELSEGLLPFPGLPADFSRADIYAERD